MDNVPRGTSRILLACCDDNPHTHTHQYTVANWTVKYCRLLAHKAHQRFIMQKPLELYVLVFDYFVPTVEWIACRCARAKTTNFSIFHLDFGFWFRHGWLSCITINNVKSIICYSFTIMSTKHRSGCRRRAMLSMSPNRLSSHRCLATKLNSLGSHVTSSSFFFSHFRIEFSNFIARVCVYVCSVLRNS